MSTVPHIEINDADRHPTCAPGGPFVAMFIVDCRPYADVEYLNQMVQRIVAYALAKFPTGGVLAIRLDTGRTWASTGYVENEGTPKKFVSGPSVAESLVGYETGCLNFRKVTNLPQVDWVGSEFENVCKLCDGLRDARLPCEVVMYFDEPGETLPDVWGAPAGSVNRQLINALCGSNRARARMDEVLQRLAPQTLADSLVPGSPEWSVRNWTLFDSFLRTVINHSCREMLDAAGFYGRFIVASSAAPGALIEREDKYPQSESELERGQFSCMGWYKDGQRTTAACVEAKHQHTVPYWPWFELPSNLNELVARVKFGASSNCTVWGDPQDLSRLNELAAALRD